MDVLLSLLVTLIVLAIFFWIVQAIVGLIGLPEPIGKIVQVVFLLICLIVCLRVLGVWGGGPYVYWHSRI
jgi:hypothetical protein